LIGDLREIDSCGRVPEAAIGAYTSDRWLGLVGCFEQPASPSLLSHFTSMGYIK
jgi:hypothetical protein